MNIAYCINISIQLAFELTNYSQYNLNFEPSKSYKWLKSILINQFISFRLKKCLISFTILLFFNVFYRLLLSSALQSILLTGPWTADFHKTIRRRLTSVTHTCTYAYILLWKIHCDTNYILTTYILCISLWINFSLS